MKKILVTGGTGFIGSALIAELQKQHCDILVYDNLSFGNRKFVSLPDDRIVVGDLLDRERLLASVRDFQPDQIVHLAAIHFIPYCNQHPFDSANINIKGTMNLLEAATELPKLELVVFASTMAIYPICDHAVTETHMPGPLDIYGLSKLTGEHLMRDFHLRTGKPALALRFSNAFGPNETNPHIIPEIARQVNEGRRTIQLGNLAPKRDFIHTSDMAVAMRLFLERFREGHEIFNLARGIEYSIQEVVDAFSRQLGEPITVEVDAARVRKVERMHLLADITKLKAFLQWEPKVSLDEGIRTLIERPA